MKASEDQAGVCNMTFFYICHRSQAHSRRFSACVICSHSRRHANCCKGQLVTYLKTAYGLLLKMPMTIRCWILLFVVSIVTASSTRCTHPRFRLDAQAATSVQVVAATRNRSFIMVFQGQELAWSGGVIAYPFSYQWTSWLDLHNSHNRLPVEYRLQLPHPIKIWRRETINQDS